AARLGCRHDHGDERRAGGRRSCADRARGGAGGAGRGGTVSGVTHVFIAAAGSLLVAEEDGGGWRVEERLAGSGAECVTVDPTRPERVYCGATEGAFRSDDGGASWAPLGLSCVTALAVDGDGTLYAGTEPSRFFRSD